MFEAYTNRREAGQHLGRHLQHTLTSLLQGANPGANQQHAAADVSLEQVVVLGLVRGGMPVADEVARALHCPCDAFVVRKVGAPLQPEFGIGAIAEGGQVIINEAAVEGVGATKQQLQDTIARETQELQRRVQAYRGGHPHLSVAGKVAVLVDDGLATGVTARAACAAVRAAGAAVVVLAVPVGAQRTVSELQEQRVADVVVCLRTPKRFRAVGAHYLDFSQTTDDEVVAILQQHPHPDTTPAAPVPLTVGHSTAAAAAAADAVRQPDTPAAARCDSGKAAGAGSQAATDAATVHDQQVAPAAAPTTPAARISSLAAALAHSPAAPPLTAAGAGAAGLPAAAAGAAAAAAAGAETRAAQGLRPVVGEQVVITDSELGGELHGSLTVPEGALGLVVFAHGSGSSRNSPRNLQVAATLNRAGLATLLFDLLSEAEAARRHNVFDIALLASRLQLAVEWLEAEGTQVAGRCPPDFPLGFFGASTGGGAALWAAAYLGPRISAVVVRGGRPDLAAAKLPAVTAPALMLVGGEDSHVLQLNRNALQMMGASDSSRLVVVPGAGHLFEGPGQLEEVAGAAVEWFTSHMGAEGGE